MKVLFAASECQPFIKTGGLGDVVGTLPIELKNQGADVRVILPKYRDIPVEWKNKMKHLLDFYVNLGWRCQYCGIEQIELNGVIYYFVDNEYYFARDSIYGGGNEEGERFAYFCRAVLDVLPQLGFVPDVIHCHDWQTGLIPALLKIQYQNIDLYKNIKTVFTIHNLKFQGIFSWAWIDDMLGFGEKYFVPDYLEYYGCISYIKGGIQFSDSVTTVSPRYAEEIKTPYYGEQLDGFIRKQGNKLIGILNGINNDEYDPRTDLLIPARYSAKNLLPKAECKFHLQEELYLEKRAEPPIIALIARLTEQKGLDLIERVLDDIMRLDVQMVILGMGDERYNELFSWAAWRYQGKIATRIELNYDLSHRIYAGADMFLMPSKFEPCGLTQMISMRYGTIPIVRETGGLVDTVLPYNKYQDTGTGFSFANYNAHEMLFTIEQAINYYYDKELWTRMIKRAMSVDFSWKTSAEKYLQLYSSIQSIQAFPITAAENSKKRAPKQSRSKK